jgi:ATP-dependent Clp protease adaptor protein ClpS
VCNASARIAALVPARKEAPFWFESLGVARILSEADISPHQDREPMSDHLPLPDVTVTPKRKERTETSPRLLPPFNVILENDDHHSFEFVIDVLRKVLGCPLERAMQLTKEAHTTGRSIVWTGPKEVAELKVEQVHSFHEIRQTDGAKLGPLGCYIEPAPGA